MKLFKILFIALSTLFFIACGGENKKESIVVGATPVPHAEILEFIKADLANEGYELVIKEFNDYVLPNLSTDSGEIDANFYQHIPYLDEFNKNNGTKLVNVAGIHLEPMAIYSAKHEEFKISKNIKIAVPNDPTNESRALDIIAKTGAVSFNENALKTPKDIISNENNINFIELKPAQTPRSLADVDYAVINANYALEAGLNPTKDGLVLEDKTSPYVNILVVKEGKEKDKKTIALIKVLQSQKVKEFIEQKYNGAVIPAF